MEKFQINDAEVRRIYESKVQELKQLTAAPVDSKDYLWDEGVERYAVTIEKVKKMFESDILKNQITSKMIKNMDTFLKKCKGAEFHIALVGAIKAGKSTLINAILGYDYASTKVTPETASLTKFRKGDRNYVKATFYSKSEWDRLWKSAQKAKADVFLNEYAGLNADAVKDTWLDHEEEITECETKEKVAEVIMRWTSSKSPEHYFVKEVEVGITDLDLPEGVVLVDTPGLDDVVEYRSNITRNYIDRANAVLVCVKADALTGQEMATIYSVFANSRYNPEKVYIIATQLDTLNQPERNWMQQREEWLKYLREKSAYNSGTLAEKNLIPVSAYLYSLLQISGSLTDDDDRQFDLDSILLKFRIRKMTAEDYKRLLAFTNIDNLKIRLNENIIKNYKKILVNDIKNSYDICRDEIRDCMEKLKVAQEDIIKTSQGSLEDIRKKQQECVEKYQETEKDKKELERLMKQFKMATQQRADQLEASIKALGGR